MEEYRIIETDKGFFVEKSVDEKWLRLDLCGDPIYKRHIIFSNGLMMPQCPERRFDTLSDARKFIKELVNPTYIVHKAEEEENLKSTFG